MLSKDDIKQLIKILRRHEWNYSDQGENCPTCDANMPQPDDSKTEAEIRKEYAGEPDDEFNINWHLNFLKERKEEGVGHKADCAFKAMLDKLEKEE